MVDKASRAHLNESRSLYSREVLISNGLDLCSAAGDDCAGHRTLIEACFTPAV